MQVDQILNQRKRKGVLEYLVRWRGFGKEEDSWEPGKNLSNCAAAMAAYIKLTVGGFMSHGSNFSGTSVRNRSKSRPLFHLYTHRLLSVVRCTFGHKIPPNSCRFLHLIIKVRTVC